LSPWAGKPLVCDVTLASVTPELRLPLSQTANCEYIGGYSQMLLRPMKFYEFYWLQQTTVQQRESVCVYLFKVNNNIIIMNHEQNDDDKSA